jgi:hypothetical protein
VALGVRRRGAGRGEVDAVGRALDLKAALVERSVQFSVSEVGPTSVAKAEEGSTGPSSVLAVASAGSEPAASVKALTLSVYSVSGSSPVAV